jgi:hyperosmotically inducible periplasmic protein
MKRLLVLAVLAFSLAAAPASAQETRKNLQLFNDVAKAVNNYAYFTIFDDISADVDNGVVTLKGRVTQPYKMNEIVKRVEKVDGVRRLVNHVTVLPLSGFDDDLRFRIARAIYGNSNFWNYGASANPSIHIVVEHGRVTLTGVVQSEVDRMLARSLASIPGTMSVKSELKTVAEMRDAPEI